jgi:hypothetical protein
MDKLTGYRELIKRILTKYVELDNRHPNPEVEHLLIADDERGHYLWLNLGWPKGERLNSPTVYVRLHNGKFWIEEDWTDLGIADELMAAGVPKEDIVLAFLHPEERSGSEFAAA